MIEIDRMVLATDWLAVRDIYADGLATSFAALLSNPPSQNEWDRAHLTLGRIFARVGMPRPSPLLPTLKGRPAPVRLASTSIKTHKKRVSAPRSSSDSSAPRKRSGTRPSKPNYGRKYRQLGPSRKMPLPQGWHPRARRLPKRLLARCRFAKAPQPKPRRAGLANTGTRLER